jgi:mono/diheme cytochrome c family protein
MSNTSPSTITSVRRVAVVAACVAAVSLAAACQRQDTQPNGNGPTKSPPPANGFAGAPSNPETHATLSAANVPSYDTAGEAAMSVSAITPALIAQGRTIYSGHGAGSASCFSCHGANAEGTTAGPHLRRADWIDADGSYGSIVRLIINGVPHPRAFPNPMPAYGGGVMTFEEVKAVAAYVYSLNHATNTSTSEATGAAPAAADARSGSAAGIGAAAAPGV